MKPLLLILSFFTLTLFVSGQDYCLYNAQKGYNIAENYSEDAYEILEQPDGRFVVIGTSYISGVNSFHITGMRLFPNGNLDPTFGNQGKIDYVFEQRNTAICATLQDDGKILVAGVQAPGNGLSSFKPYVARIKSDGTVDTEFGLNGTAFVPHSSTNDGCVVGIKAFDNGKIQLITTHLQIGGTVSRLLSNGDPDSTFNGVGYLSGYQVPGSVILYDNPTSHITEDGTSYYVGLQVLGDNRNLGIAKYNPDGTLSEDFGVNGQIVVTSINGSYNTSIRSTIGFDGNLIVSFTNGENLPSVMKLDSNTGELVESFGDNGFAVAPISALGGEIFDMVANEEQQEWVILLDGTSDICLLCI